MKRLRCSRNCHAQGEPYRAEGVRRRQTDGFFCTFVLLVLLLVVAGCGAEAKPPVPLPTLAPVATIVIEQPTPVVPEQLPDVLAATQQLAQKNYADAVRALMRASTSYPDLAVLQDRLAEAQLVWGTALIARATDPSSGRSQALDRFSSGLAVVQSADLRTQLQTELEVTTSLIWIITTTQQLNTALVTSTVSSTLHAAATAITAEVERLLAAHPDEPGIALLASAALIANGRVLLLDADPAAKQQAERLCTRAIELGGENKMAHKCITDAQPPTEPTPTQPPTRPTRPPPPQNLKIIPDIRGADVGRARDFLRNVVGFTGTIGVIEVTDYPQITGVCRQGVLYTSPPKGKSVPANTQIIIFYRGSTNAPGLQDCNAS